VWLLEALPSQLGDERDKKWCFLIPKMMVRCIWSKFPLISNFRTFLSLGFLHRLLLHRHSFFSYVTGLLGLAPLAELVVSCEKLGKE
jgi:hypothetical protein